MKNIQKSEIFTVDTPSNYFAVEYFTVLLNHLSCDSSLCISANNFEKMYVDLEKSSENISYCKDILKNCKFLFMKEDWLSIYEEYGFSGVSNEIFSILNSTGANLIFFNSIDILLANVDKEKIEGFLFSLTNNIQYQNKKILFSYNSQTNRGSYIDEVLKKLSDIHYKNSELVETFDSFYEKIEYFLQKRDTPETNINLISDQDDFIKANQTLFKDKINVNLIVSDKIDKEADIIVLNLSREIKKDTILAIKKNLSNVKLILFLQNKVLREIDKEHYTNLGIDLVLDKNYDFLNYVKFVEKEIKDNFYSSKIKNFTKPDFSNTITYEQLLLLVDTLNSQNIIHSLLSIEDKYLNNSFEKNLRKYDFVHYSYHDNNTTIFILLNITPNRAKELISKRFNIPKEKILIHKEVFVC